MIAGFVRIEPLAIVSARGIPEILAPAGGRSQFFAALNSGADAVYLGLREFNARARAENFSLEDLRELVPLARTRGMRVLVAANVVIKQEEMPRLLADLAELDWISPYALIIQDLGLARLVRTHFPRLRMHASTQLAIHNAGGVMEAAKLGFRRVVLARELTARDVRKIREAVGDDVELEVFCHGSLCYSYSGLCFFSGAEDARSGNRGECAYTCRKPYRIINEPGHGFLFSMKDLDTSEEVGRLIEAGVDALKIEGRKKDAQYVASAVNLYRTRRDAILRGPESDGAREFETDLKYSYQRDTTSFFVKGRYHENVIDLDNPGHRGVLIGTVRRVHGSRIEFTTSAPLELYDGIRIDRPEPVYHAKPQQGVDVRSSLSQAQARYENEICQFSLRELEAGGRRLTSCSAGEHVVLEAPSGARVQSGDHVFRVRSNELKRRIDAITSPPDRLRPLCRFSLRIIISAAEQVEIVASVLDSSEVLASAHLSAAPERPRGESTLERDLRESFSMIGDAGVECDVSLEGDLNWFVPRSKIKDLKRNLSDALKSSLPAQLEVRKQKMREAGHPVRRSWDPPAVSRLQIKFDRPEFLSPIESFLAKRSGLVDEIVFEPRKTVLAGSGIGGPEELTQWFSGLQQLSQKHGLRVRLALPVVIRSWDEAHLKSYVSAFESAGGKDYEIANLGALALLQGTKSRSLAADFTLYVLNSFAAEQLRDLGFDRAAASIEDDRRNLSELLAGWPAEIEPQAILYKDTPLFIAEACSLTALHNGCPTSRVCGYRTLEIENDAGERFFVAHEQCKSVVYGKRAFSLLGSRRILEDMGVRRFRIDLLMRPYSADAIDQILDAAALDRPLADTHSANFHRHLL